MKTAFIAVLTDPRSPSKPTQTLCETGPARKPADELHLPERTTGPGVAEAAPLLVAAGRPGAEHAEGNGRRPEQDAEAGDETEQREQIGPAGVRVPLR